MLYRLAADLLVLVHLLFILFVAAGGLLVLRWPRLAWLHLPAALWGGLIEIGGWICPLTPWENTLRRSGGEGAYSGDFIDHYLVPLVYPPGLTRGMQITLGILVLVLNAGVYTALLLRRRAQRRGGAAARPAPGRGADAGRPPPGT